MPDVMSTQDRAAMAKQLLSVLADTYGVYARTHLFHWNVSGPQFHTLHKLFEEQYTELWGALDEIAERVRSLGAVVPADYASRHRSAALKGDGEDAPKANDMVKQLVAAQESLTVALRAANTLAGELGDVASEDLLAPRLSAAEKSIWMLRSSLA